MKRKLKLIAVFKSTWWRFFDAMLRAPFEFYPPEQKRIFFEHSTTYRSISLRNGQLYAGCLQTSCPRKCVPMREFVPVVNKYFWLCALEAHNAAVDALDLDVATEQRAIIDHERHWKCLVCRGQDEVRHELLEPQAFRIPRGRANRHAHEEAREEAREEADNDVHENVREDATPNQDEDSDHDNSYCDNNSPGT